MWALGHGPLGPSLNPNLCIIRNIQFKGITHLFDNNEGPPDTNTKKYLPTKLTH